MMKMEETSGRNGRELDKLNFVYNAMCTNLDLFSISVLLISLYLCYYFTYVVHRAKLHCSDGPFKLKLLNHLRELNKNIYPFVWCYRPIFQSILHNAFIEPIDIPFIREELAGEDGGCFTLDFYGFESKQTEVQKDIAEENTNNKPIILIFPGATGHSEKVYVREFISCALESNYRAVAFNYRGMVPEVPMKNSRLACVTRSDDIEAAFKYIQQKCPTTPILVAAFSIGACAFMNYLIRKGNQINASIVAAIMVGTPWDPTESKNQLSRFWENLVINKHMTGQLLEAVERNKDTIEKDLIDSKIPINLEELHKCKTVWDFDDRYICPMYGYKNHEEFYNEASLKRLPIENITVPVLCVSSADDPLCREQAIPLKHILKNPLVAVVVTKYGGHLSWLEGILFTNKRFIHRLFQQYTNMFFKDEEVNNS